MRSLVCEVKLVKDGRVDEVWKQTCGSPFVSARVRTRTKRRSNWSKRNRRWAQPFPRTGCGLLRDTNINPALIRRAIVEQTRRITGSDELFCRRQIMITNASSIPRPLWRLRESAFHKARYPLRHCCHLFVADCSQHSTIFFSTKRISNLG